MLPACRPNYAESAVLLQDVRTFVGALFSENKKDD